MESTKEEPRMKCFENLSAIGATTELCEFLADILQCESDMMHATGKHLMEINDQMLTGQKIDRLTEILQKVLKRFLKWKDQIDDLERRKAHLPGTLKVDQTKLGQMHSFKAICSLETAKTSLKQGEDVEITDSSHPDIIKVRNTDGKEGYLPLLSCFVPAPDLDLNNCIERLQVQLMTCSSDLTIKLQRSLPKTLVSALQGLLNRMDATYDLSHDWSAVQKFKGRSKLFLESLEDGQLHLKHLAGSLRSLENHLIKNNMEANLSDSEEIRKLIADIDKPILFFLALRDNLAAYRKELKSGYRPIRIVPLDSKALSIRRDKPIRYYEVRLTVTDTTIREEHTYLTPRQDQQKPTNNVALDSKTSKKSCSVGISKHSSVQSVIDPRTNEEISVKDAVALGIVDHRSGSYINPDTGEKLTISAAMSRGLIKIVRRKVSEDEHDENGNIIRSDNRGKVINEDIGRFVGDVEPISRLSTTLRKTNLPMGLITLKTRVIRDEYQILSALDFSNDRRVDAFQAEKLGIIKEGFFVNTKTDGKVSLDESVRLGWVEVASKKLINGDSRDESSVSSDVSFLFEEHEAAFEVEQVYDGSAGCFVSFLEAVKRHLVDPSSGCVVDNLTNELIFPSEAIEKGLIKVRPVESETELRPYCGSPVQSLRVAPASSAHRYLLKSPSPCNADHHEHHFAAW